MLFSYLFTFWHVAPAISTNFLVFLVVFKCYGWLRTCDIQIRSQNVICEIRYIRKLCFTHFTKQPTCLFMHSGLLSGQNFIYQNRKFSQMSWNTSLVKWQARSWTTRVRFPVGTGIFLFVAVSRQTLGPTKLAFQWVLGGGGFFTWTQ
jgi:hypothetical protein